MFRVRHDPGLCIHRLGGQGEEIFLLVGQGNFVATLCKAFWEGQPFAQVDIFRFEEGKVVEHWDNAEPVPPEEEWVNSGKF